MIHAMYELKTGNLRNAIVSISIRSAFSFVSYTYLLTLVISLITDQFQAPILPQHQILMTAATTHVISVLSLPYGIMSFLIAIWMPRLLTRCNRLARRNNLQPQSLPYSH